MKYETVANVAFGVGALLGLSDAQAAPRAAYLKPVPGRKGWFTTTAPVHLKRGETFLSEDVLPKSMVDLVDFEGKEDLKVQTSAQKGSKKGSSKPTSKAPQQASEDSGAQVGESGGASELGGVADAEEQDQ